VQVANVTRLCRRLATDLRDNTQQTPDFPHRDAQNLRYHTPSTASQPTAIGVPNGGYARADHQHVGHAS
jgi:hypothetical protein